LIATAAFLREGATLILSYRQIVDCKNITALQIENCKYPARISQQGLVAGQSIDTGW
jgi:hypothetical protein